MYKHVCIFSIYNFNFILCICCPIVAMPQVAKVATDWGEVTLLLLLLLFLPDSISLQETDWPPSFTTPLSSLQEKWAMFGQTYLRYLGRNAWRQKLGNLLITTERVRELSKIDQGRRQDKGQGRQPQGF